MLQLPRLSIVPRALIPLVCIALSPGCASRSIALTNLTDGDRQWVWPHFIDGQPTALVFWNTNEMECYRNVPALQGLNTRTGSVQLVSVVTGRDRLEIQKWIREKRIRYPVLLDLEEKLAGHLGVDHYPTFVLFGPDGKELDREEDIRLVKTWFSSEDRYSRLQQASAEDVD